ncbi:10555_t:CDS:2, partial [Funneliformis caledonium]
IKNTSDSCNNTSRVTKVYEAQDVIESLTTVKYVALIALDSLLRQIVSENTLHILPPPVFKLNTTLSKVDTRKRSASESHRSCINMNPVFESLPREERDAWLRSQLLAGIADNATKLGVKNEIKQIDSGPISSDVATLDRIQHHLDANVPYVPNDDYNLACTLAALLGYLYQILELSELQGYVTNSHSAEELLHNINGDNIYSTLHKEVTTLQNRRVSLSQHSNVADERLATWNEIDRLMEIVASLCRDRLHIDPPPRYSYDIDDKGGSTIIDPPKYSFLGTGIMNNEKTKVDLDNVISAIERVYYVAPQLNNQRVELNARQKKELTAATLSSAIQKLSRGRFEEQRAESTSVLKYQTLNCLVDQIQKSAAKSLVNQRVELSPRQVRDFEVAKLSGVIDRLDKNRMTDQDWHPPEQLLIQDLTRLTCELSSPYASQRFHLSSAKEKDMYMNNVMKKVGKLRSYRFENQDAHLSTKPDECSYNEIENIIAKMQYSPSMENQRATWSPKKSKFPFYLTE